ncbi:DUF2523 domain-containing protein [Vibrio nigripulchritudo]|uniref:DUF2523 domain-containing protein n=1 Tax=Vibrio nigripulchritudo TaxID=28173 RepID=UPI0003B214E8|nr:DUF2523 domain-containing protein [Vibrio nigripulchritudo]CCO41387.1 hypothetical protein VIBNISFn135_460003 [Vibrio nigripulchritudo SFn135]
MAAIFTWLLAFMPFLVPLLKSILVRLGVSLGFGIATFTGLFVFVENIMTEMINQMSGLPSDILKIMGLAGVDSALNILFSGMIALMTFKGVTKAGNFSRLNIGKSGG